MLGFMTLYTTQRKQHLCWSDQSNHRVGTQQELGSEMRKSGFVEEYSYLGHVMSADCRDDKDIKKQLRRQNVVGNMLVRKFSFAPIEAKIQLFKSYCYPIYGRALWRQSYQNSIRNLAVIYS